MQCIEGIPASLPGISAFKEKNMPIYEYRCAECQQVFEEWCKHVDDGSVSRACPICRGVSKRLVSNTSFALKGAGWYVTEYGTHKKQAAAESAASASANGTAAATAAPAESAKPSPSPVEARG
jgi:putative FmdB family regulatory protein